MNRFPFETIDLAQIKMLSLRRILIFCGVIYVVKGARECTGSSKAHLTRCDMYYKCTVMPSGNVVWVPNNCPNGLVYDTAFRNCVIPGDDWECHAENEGRSSSAADDDENVYGVNNLSYLKEQVKGYGTTDSDFDESSIEQQNDDYDHDYMKVDNENLYVTMSQNGTVSFEGSSNSNTSTNEIESSGDGELPEHDNNLEIKTDYIPIPTTDKLVASQLQRLTQLIKNVKNENDATTTSEDLTPSELNQFLALHKLKVKEFHSNKNAVPLPQNKLIDEHHLQQILDLQKKLNALAHHRDAYSTQAPPVKFTVSNGHYPPEATTVHINTANALKNPRFPNVGASTSQIVVNRPGGTVVFRLPYSNSPTTTTAAAEQKPSNEKSENHINTDTLKMILELSKYMSNQAPNTPQFVHSLAPTRNSYLQSTTASVIHPALNNFPFGQLNAQTLAALMNLLQSGKFANDDTSSMERIATVSGSVPYAGHTASEPDDVGPTTIIHNHIPITVSNPRPTGPTIITRNHLQQQMSPSSTTTTTARPVSNDRFDSYGDLNDRPASEYAGHKFYSYPNFPEKLQQWSSVVGSVVTPQQQQQHYSSLNSKRPNNNYNNENDFEDQPNYVQIAQSKPNEYTSQYSDIVTAFGNRPMSTAPTFLSINGGHTNKIYSPYTPQPHLDDENVNDYVSIDEKPYPTFTSAGTGNYIPIAVASSPKPTYADPTETFTRRTKRPLLSQHGNIFDKLATFESVNKPNENYDDDDGGGIVDDNENDGYGNNDGESDHFEQLGETNVDQFDDDNDNNDDENVMNLLANYKSEQIPATAKTVPSTASTAIQIVDGSSSDEQQRPALKKQNRHTSSNDLRHKQFVSLNGNFMTLETYQQTIEPFLAKDSQSNLQIEVLTCATGVRQTNHTDCTRYFVCNEKTGKILSYKCPPYTAFNGDIKLCNGETYAKCVTNDGAGNSISNQQKTQQLVQLMKVQRDKILNSVPQTVYKQQSIGNVPKTTRPNHSIPTTQAPVKVHKTVRKPTAGTTSTTTAHRRKPQPNTNTRKQKPAPIQSTQSANGAGNNKLRGKRIIPCKKEGKLADDRSIRHYFLCYKDQTKSMRARRLQCPAKLTFCPSSLICTATERCTK